MAKPQRKPSVSHSVWFYRKQLLTSPAHALVILLPVTLWLFTLNFGVALASFLIVEGLLFAVAPYFPSARRAIDARLEQQARESAATRVAPVADERGAPASLRSRGHRRARTTEHGRRSLDDCLGLEPRWRPTSGWHYTGQHRVTPPDAACRFENSSLSRDAPARRSPRQVALARRAAVPARGSTAADRARRASRAAGDLATIGHHRLMRENRGRAQQSVRAEVMRTVDVACNDSAVLRDLSRLHEPAPFDPRVLELGRGVRAAVPPPAPVAVRVVVDPTTQSRVDVPSEPLAMEAALMAVSRT